MSAARPLGRGLPAQSVAGASGVLPASMAGAKERLGGYLRDLVDGCVSCMRPDGLFHDVLDDPASFVETNAAQMIACAIYRGVALGCLGEPALAHAERMREAAHRKVDAHGLVRDACGSPRFDGPGTSPEGQAFFLLMEAARRRLPRLRG